MGLEPTSLCECHDYNTLNPTTSIIRMWYDGTGVRKFKSRQPLRVKDDQGSFEKLSTREVDWHHFGGDS